MFTHRRDTPAGPGSRGVASSSVPVWVAGLLALSAAAPARSPEAPSDASAKKRPARKPLVLVIKKGQAPAKTPAAPEAKPATTPPAKSTAKAAEKPTSPTAKARSASPRATGTTSSSAAPAQTVTKPQAKPAASAKGGAKPSPEPASAAAGSAAKPAAAKAPPVGTKQVRPAAAQASGAALVLRPSRLEVGPGESGFLVELTLRPPGRKKAEARVAVEAPPGVTVTPAEWSGSVSGWGAKAYFRVGAGSGAKGSLPVRFVATFGGGGQAATTTLAVSAVTPLVAALRPDVVGSNVKVWVRNLLKTRPLKARVAVANQERFLKDIISRMTPEIPPGGSAEVAIPVMREGIAPDVFYRFDATVRTFQGYETKTWRNLSYLFAPRAKGTPATDGSLNGWGEAYVVAARGPATFRLAGVSFRIVWDPAHLYVQARVTDRGASAGEGAPDSGSAVEMGFEPTGLHLPGARWLQLVVSGSRDGASGPSVSLREMPSGETKSAAGVRAQVLWRQDQGIYTLAVPWKLLGITPRVGTQFGFSARAVVSGAKGPEQLGWGQGLPTLGEDPKPGNPLLFGDLTLTSEDPR